MVSVSGSESSATSQCLSKTGSHSSKSVQKQNSHSSDERSSRWKARLKFDVETSNDEEGSKNQTNGDAKNNFQVKEEVNSSEQSERSLSDDCRSSTPSSEASGEQPNSDRRALLSPRESISDIVSGRDSDGDDIAPTTSDPERTKEASRSKHRNESEELENERDKPRKYRQKRFHTSSPSESDVSGHSRSPLHRWRSPKRAHSHNNRGKRPKDDVSPYRRRSPERKRQRRSRSRRSDSQSGHRHSTSHNIRRSHWRHRSETSPERRHHKDTRQNEYSREGSTDRGLADRNGKLDDAERRRQSNTRSRYPTEKVQEEKGKFTRMRMDSEEEEEREQQTKMSQAAREDAVWAERREERERRGAHGVRSIWGESPSMREIHAIYQEYERMEEEQQERARKEEERSRQKATGKTIKKEKSKKEKDKKKSKKHKKKKKKKKSLDSNESSEEEWIEVTKEMREAEAAKEKLEEASMVGPAVPEHLLQKQAALIDHTKHVNYGKDMLRGEAAAMAAYIAQGKRIPRRGEIGLSSAEISEFEKIGYVMSGTRHKSMEATRLRKENQVMTAEEKRLLSGFTHDERKKKEEIVLQQFRSFIESKKAKN